MTTNDNNLTFLFLKGEQREIIVAVPHTLLVLALAALLVVSVSAIATCRLLIKAYFNTYYSLFFCPLFWNFAQDFCKLIMLKLFSA